MGAAAARRLAGLGYEVRVWNRSPDKARALASDRITVAATARDAVEAADLCIALLSTTDAVRQVVEACRGLAFDAVLANLASGSPDDGRAVAAAVADALPNATYVDGAYCGPPSALEHRGVRRISSRGRHKSPPRRGLEGRRRRGGAHGGSERRRVRI